MLVLLILFSHIRYLLLNLAFYLGSAHFDTFCYPLYALCLNQTCPSWHIRRLKYTTHVAQVLSSHCVLPGNIIPHCRPSVKKSSHQTSFSRDLIIRYIPEVLLSISSLEEIDILRPFTDIAIANSLALK